MKTGPRDKKVAMLIAGEELNQLKRFTVDMSEAFGLDKKIKKYAGKRSMNFYQWDMDCLLAVIELALKDDSEYPDKSSSACMALGRLRNRMLDEYGMAYGQEDCTMKKVSRTTIFQFRAKLAAGLWRDLEIDGSDTLEDLAVAILATYKFECDHCYGFYSKLKGRMSDSTEIYELFEDIEDGSGAQNAKGVRDIRIDEAFSAKKQMRFLFDYGDQWEFVLTCNSIVSPEPNVQYPRTTGGKGDAPEQYPAYEE